MQRQKPNALLLVTFVGSICYPLSVYIGLSKFPVSVFSLLGIILIGLRLATLRNTPDFKLWACVFTTAAISLIAMLFISPRHAAQAYPVAVSLAVAAIFGLSLAFPPSLVERIARFSDPALPDAARGYTRNVTIIWTIFLVVNALISAGFAAWGTMGQWTLWNGLLSYVAMGVLFVGEYAVRKVLAKWV